MKTGNTADIIRPGGPARIASMEPGHEDREYQQTPVECETHREASMEPGHEDREYYPTADSAATNTPQRLNGARS